MYESIVFFGVGIAVGMYIVSQIGSSIEQNIKRKKFNRDLNNFKCNQKVNYIIKDGKRQKKDTHKD